MEVKARERSIFDFAQIEQNNGQKEMMHEATDAEIQLGKYYEEMYQQAENEQKNIEAMYLREPVFSGYYGGANQYPVISSTMFSLISPDALLGEGLTTSIGLGANAYKASKTWRTFANMAGKGMTFTKKAQMYRNHLKISNSIINLSTKFNNGYKNFEGARNIYEILTDKKLYEIKQKTN